MTSKDPPNPPEMRHVYISEARCSSHLLRPSKRYRLDIPIQSRPNIIGLRSPKSKYVQATQDVVTWKDPFGDQFTVVPTLIAPNNHSLNIALLKRRLGHPGRFVASCNVELSSATDKEIRLDLTDGANKKVGELTIFVASSLASTRDAVENVNQDVEQLGPGLAVLNNPIQAAAPLTAEITTQSNAWQPLLSRLGALVKVADTVAEAHPWIKLAWGVVSAAYRIASAQSERDARVMDLVRTMADSCSFGDEAKGLKDRSEIDRDIVNQILRQVMECAYFIRDYCRDTSFINRVGKHTVSLVDTKIEDYKTTLDTLRRNLIDHANIQCSVITSRVLDVVTEAREWEVLSDLRYARDAHHDLDNACLAGTRTEIIDAIVRWAVGADTPLSDPRSSMPLRPNESSRVLWLCGTAGAGKSSILRSCAKRIRDLERMGSYYGFDKSTPLVDLTNLFGTIARDLADLDKSRQQRLVDAVKNETAIRTTGNCKLQFQHFIVASFRNDKAVGETIVFIDAFDESGDVTDRADALAILTKRASELPSSLRVVVTSRYERDIQDMLQSPLPLGVDVMLVDDIPAAQTSRDIATYVYNELRNVNGLRAQKYQNDVDTLIRMAGTSFQWAATACRFISSDKAGVDPRDQIRTMLRADTGLYGLYSTVMKEHCNPSDDMAVQRVKSILGRIICAQEPLSLHTLVHLVPSDSIITPDDMEIQGRIVKHLASLLSGTHNDHEPIVPLHSSYRDFLCNPEHNKDFYIDKGEANERMALACFRVMDESLKFNICELPTSFLRNADIPDIRGLIDKYISDHLSYACRYWCFHVSTTPPGRVPGKHMESFFQKDFLHWLEVMSLTESSPQSALASLNASHIAEDLVGVHYDAIEFISMFRVAIRTSAPHIYLSGLTFAPTSSLVYQQWQGQFPGVGKLVHGQLQHWPQIRLILKGHDNCVTCVAFSPDGKQIASSSWDETIRLWNAETGASIGKPMEGHGGKVHSIAFSPDGKQIASGSENTIQLWNVETGAGVGQPMQGHNDFIFSIAFSPDGMQIASGSQDKTIRLWNVEAGTSIGQPMEGHGDGIWSIAFSPDGKQIASGSKDKTIGLWNAETGARIGQPMQGHNEMIFSIAFSPDGKQIASGSGDGTIQLWSAATGVSIGELEGSDVDVRSIAFSPDGKQIASCDYKFIRLWNVETGASIGQPMQGHNELVWSIVFSPDGTQIASGSLDHTICLWNVDIGESIGQPTRGHSRGITSIAFSPDGKQIASGSEDQTIQLWDAETGASIGQPMLGHSAPIESIAFSPDGAQIASGSGDWTLQLWSVETCRSIGQPMEGHDGEVYSIAFSPDGKQIASGSNDKTIQLWNAETGESIGQPMEGHHKRIKCIAFLPDGKQIASGSDDQTIQLWNVETCTSIIQPIQQHNDGIQSIAFSPDGKQIASSSWDETIRLWNAETGASIGQPMEGHSYSIPSIAFSPDGKQIASGSADATVRLWNVDTGASIGQPMEGHHDTIWSIAFSPDGKQIASGSEDQTIRLWSLEMYSSVGQEHDSDIYSTAFLPNGKQITSGSDDNTVKISQLPIAMSKHILQYPIHLFPLPPHSFHLEGGWILGPSDELILWVPPAYTQFLEHPNCHLVGSTKKTQIDFQHLKCGEDWAQCQELEC